MNPPAIDAASFQRRLVLLTRATMVCVLVPNRWVPSEVAATVVARSPCPVRMRVMTPSRWLVLSGRGVVWGDSCLSRGGDASPRRCGQPRRTMRAGTATQHERLMRVHRRHADRASEAGLTELRFSDLGDGSTIRVDGRDLVNFGNCSYLGLSVDPRLKRAAIEAIERFGPLYASSQMYAAVELYVELETLLAKMTDAP